MARKKDDIEDIIDLTELIEPGSAQKSAPAASTPPADDFEALLAQTEAGDSGLGGASQKRPVDPDEKLDMSDMGDIDNLLDTLDIPAQPEEPARAAPAAGASPDMDSVLDDLLGGSPAPKAAPPEEESLPEPDIDADLDDILASFDEGAPKPAPSSVAAPQSPPQAREPEPGPQQTAGTDFDNILDGFMTEPAQDNGDAPDQASDELDDLLGDMDKSADIEEVSEPAPAAATEPENPELPPDLDGLLDEPAQEPAGSVQPHAFEELADTPEFLTQEPASSRKEETLPQIAPAQPHLVANILSAHAASQETLHKISAELGAQSAHIEDLTRHVTDLAKRLLGVESKLAVAKSRIAALEKSLEAKASIEELLRPDSPLNQGFSALLVSAIQQAFNNSSSLAASGSEASAAIASLGQRLDSIEASLNNDGAMKAELDSLAASGSEASAAIASLGQRLDSIEASLQEAHGAEEAAKIINARMDSMEKRLDGLEPNFNIQVEKAAASAVARLLHEEISRLAQTN